MHRRQFIRDVLLWSAGVSLALPRFTISPTAMAVERPAPLVSVARSADYPALVAQVLEPLGSMPPPLSARATGWWSSRTSAGTAARNRGPTPTRRWCARWSRLRSPPVRRGCWSSTGPATSRGAAMLQAASRPQPLLLFRLRAGGFLCVGIIADGVDGGGASPAGQLAQFRVLCPQNPVLLFEPLDALL